MHGFPLRNSLALLLLIPLLLPYALVPVYWIVRPVSTVMLGSLFAGEGMRRDWVSIDRLPPHLALAVLASEDGRFCDHAGIDWVQMDKAVAQSKRTGHAPRGASTITAQTAKNLFLWRARSWVRKALEASLTLWLDLVLPKRRILEIYLNIAEWGPGIFGAEAAAQYHFHKSASRLTLHESALLAAALPAPLRRLPERPSAFHRQMAERIEARMRQAPEIAGCTSLWK